MKRHRTKNTSLQLHFGFSNFYPILSGRGLSRIPASSPFQPHLFSLPMVHASTKHQTSHYPAALQSPCKGACRMWHTFLLFVWQLRGCRVRDESCSLVRTTCSGAAIAHGKMDARTHRQVAVSPITSDIVLSRPSFTREDPMIDNWLPSIHGALVSCLGEKLWWTGKALDEVEMLGSYIEAIGNDCRIKVSITSYVVIIRKGLFWGPLCKTSIVLSYESI